MRVAIVHDWLTGMRGGERCLEAFLDLYPAADLYTLFHVPDTTSPKIEAALRGTSFIQQLPFSSKYYRTLLPFFPSAIKSIKLEGYDLVISLSHAAAKNITLPQGTKHLSYCFTPMRYIWDQAQVYFGKATPLLWPLIKYLRAWDVAGAERVDKIAGISDFVSARIRCFYGLRVETIYPPVEFPNRGVNFNHQEEILQSKEGEAFLYAGALVKYKRVDAIVRAFNRSALPLWIVGDGGEMERLKRLAKSNIHFFGRLSDPELWECYTHCRALLFAGVEDFGLVPVECLMAGRPVIGLDAGGISEILTAPRFWLGEKFNAAKDCGIFIRSNSDLSLEDEILSSLNFFLAHEEEFLRDTLKKRAQLFSLESFREKWLAFAEGHKEAKIGNG
jgi:glycosyltransferase involved in cell wall biosynthesis